jgi:hypothetical protein
MYVERKLIESWTRKIGDGIGYELSPGDTDEDEGIVCTTAKR